MTLFSLLQARDPNDPVREEERAAFAQQLGVSIDRIRAHDLLKGGTSFDTVTQDVDVVLVGGSGAYSVLDSVDWMPGFFSTLRQLAERDFPTFASCFGFQGLVMAMGGSVIHDEPNAEVGTFDVTLAADASHDPVFSGLPSTFPVQLGHKDRASVLPRDIVHLASSARCPYQAFRVGKNVYATQFHPELSGDANRTRFSRYLDGYSKVFGETEAQRMLDSFQPSLVADSLMARFVDVVVQAR